MYLISPTNRLERNLIILLHECITDVECRVKDREARSRGPDDCDRDLEFWIARATRTAIVMAPDTTVTVTVTAISICPARHRPSGLPARNSCSLDCYYLRQDEPVQQGDDSRRSNAPLWLHRLPKLEAGSTNPFFKPHAPAAPTLPPAPPVAVPPPRAPSAPSGLYKNESATKTGALRRTMPMTVHD